MTGRRPGTARVTAVYGGTHTATAQVQVLAIPSTMEVLQGQHQTGVVDAPLPVPIRLRVLSRGRAPVADVEVQFDVPGTAIQASLAGRMTPTVSIEATASAASLASVELTPAAVLSNPGLTTQFVARTVDRFGNAVENGLIRWETTDPSVMSIDSDGAASCYHSSTPAAAIQSPSPSWISASRFSAQAASVRPRRIPASPSKR